MSLSDLSLSDLSVSGLSLSDLSVSGLSLPDAVSSPLSSLSSAFSGLSGGDLSLSSTIAARRPQWSLKWAGKDVTENLLQWVTSVTYTDVLEGSADTIAFAAENRDGRWYNSWYPAKGDVLALSIGYAGEAALPCGDFTIDTIAFSAGGGGSGDTVSLHALSASISEALRTKQSRAFENLSLAEVVGKVAEAHGLTVSGSIPDVAFKRLSQDNEDDLAFLARIAKDYDCAFNVRGSLLVFHDTDDLAARDVALSLGRADMSQLSLDDRCGKIYKACEVSYQNPETNKTITLMLTAGGEVSVSESEAAAPAPANTVTPAAAAAATASGATASGATASGEDTGDSKAADNVSVDVWKEKIRVENVAQAEMRAKAILRRLNRKAVSGKLSLPGNVAVLAGNTVEITGMGKLSGVYLVGTSTHSISRSAGYKTEAEVVLIR